jgi:serine/threonine-protein kinase
MISHPLLLAPGTLVNDRYEVRHKSGALGHRVLFLAFDRSTKEERVLEIECVDHEPDEQKLQAWAQMTAAWVALAQRVSHPNVCRVFGMELSDWGPIVITEHVAGSTLHKFIRDRQSKGGVTADELRKIAADLWSGLAALHERGVIHGDIKPGKIRIADADAEPRAVIHHFWAALSAEAVEARDPNNQADFGTPNYMSPARLLGGGASFKDDVYALGMTLWEMFTCRVPNPGENPRDKPIKEQMMCDQPDLSLVKDELRQIFQALHEDPVLRPDARDFLARPAREDSDDGELTAAVKIAPVRP